MPRRMSEVGEGTDDSINGVYGLIRDLLVDGKDARFVNRRGRYVLNWSRALDRYADYKARKNPHFKRKNLTRRKASNGLRSALLNCYKNKGAKEYKEFKKVNDKDEVVERQFQMPPRVFESLFGNTVPSSGESGLSEQEDEQEINSITSEDEKDAQSTPNSSDHGFDETVDQSYFVAEDICPASGPVKGGYTFHISFPEPLSEDVSSGMAEFHGVATVQVHKLNPFTLSGSVPPSDQSGDVSVTVTTQSGQLHLCTTCFHYVDQMREVAQQLVHDPAKRRLWFEMLLEEYGFFGTDSHFVQMLDRLNTEYQGITGAWPETISNDLPVSAEPGSLTSPHELSTSPNVDGVLNVSPDAALHGQTFDTSAVESVLENGILDEIPENLDLFGVVDDICPPSGSLKGGYPFYISLTEPLSEDVSSGMAEFEGVAMVPVHKRNPFTLSGSVPSSDQPRDVPVRVVTQTGQCLGMTHFQYVEEMHDMARQLVHDPAKQALWFAILLEEYGFFGFDSDLAQVLDPLDMQCQGLSEEKSSDDSSENNSDTDYFADVETSSIDSLGYQTLSRSTSEDNISKLYSKEQMKASTHQSISSIGKGAFARNGIMLKTGQIREGVQRKSYVLILRDSHFDSSLPEVVKGLDYTLAFHLAMGSTSIPRQLHTANESFLALRGSRKAQPIIFFCECHLSLDVLLEGSLVKNNNDHISRAVATKQHCCNQLNEGILAELRTQIPVEKAIPVDWKSSDISVKQSGVHTHRDLWVFTSAFRPTRKTLFVYFADRRDDLPPSNFFEDEDCESQIRCWKWKRSGNNSFKFTETLKAGKLLPGGGKSQMESHTDLPVTYIVRDKQAQTQSESGTCLSWMHAMMHHCWTTESTEKASNITIFDRFLGMRLIHGRLRNSRTPSIISLSVADDGDTEFLSPSGFYEQEFLKGSSSGLRSDDDSKKPKLSLYHQVATSSVENSKKIFKKCTMGAPILHDLTDGQIKGSEAKESKVQSDSSKPQTTADAGVSLPTFVKPAREVNRTKSQFHMAKTSKENFAKCTRVASFSGDLTDSTIIQVNMGEVTKVQADSSNTQTTIDAGESLETLTIDNSKHRDPLASASRTCGLMLSDIGNDEVALLLLDVGKSSFAQAICWEMATSCTFPDDFTHFKIEDNRGNETKVQANSSKTKRIVDAGKSLSAFVVDNSEFARAHDSAMRPLRTDLLMSSDSTHDDRNKGKLNICKPVVASCVGNTKVNCEKYGMVKSVFSDDDTDCKIKGNEAKVRKIQADSSKTETIIDASIALLNLELTLCKIELDLALLARERTRLACERTRLDAVLSVLYQRDSSSCRDISRIIKGNPYGNMMEGTFDDLLVWPFAGTVTVSVIDRSDSSSRRDISRIIEGNPYGNMMQGTFDDLLVWPFAGTVTVSVIDRSGSRASSNISRIIQAKPNLFAFQQPHETICGTGYGCERFAPIEKFFGPRYVKDGKLLLKIEFSG